MAGTRNYDFLVSIREGIALEPIIQFADLVVDQTIADRRLGCGQVMLPIAFQ